MAVLGSVVKRSKLSMTAAGIGFAFTVTSIAYANTLSELFDVFFDDECSNSTCYLPYVLRGDARAIGPRIFICEEQWGAR